MEQVAYAIVEATAQTSRVTFHEASGTWRAEVMEQQYEDLSGQTFWFTLAYEHVEAEAYWAIANHYRLTLPYRKHYTSHQFKPVVPPARQSAHDKPRSEHPQQLDPATIEVTGDDFLGAGTYNRTARNEWVMEAQGRKFYIRYGVAHNNMKNFGTKRCRHCKIHASRSCGYRGWVLSESNNNYYDGYKTLAYVGGRYFGHGVTNSDDHNPFQNNIGFDGSSRHTGIPIWETTETQSMVVAGSKGKLSVTLNKVAQ